MWNKFKCKKLNNSNYDNSYGGGDFSHEYVIMHQYFGKFFLNAINKCISIYRQFDMFSCIIISYTCDLYLGPQIPSLLNTNNQANGFF